MPPALVRLVPYSGSYTLGIDHIMQSACCLLPFFEVSTCYFFDIFSRGDSIVNFHTIDPIVLDKPFRNYYGTHFLVLSVKP